MSQTHPLVGGAVLSEIRERDTHSSNIELSGAERGAMTTPSRPLPALDECNEFFWTAGANGELRFLRCTRCRAFVHPPQPACRVCGATELATEAVSGRARVAGWTVNHQLWHPAFAPPYIIGVVAIEEDRSVRLTTNLVDVEPDELVLDLSVEVTFEHHQDVWLPMFRPVR